MLPDVDAGSRQADGAPAARARGGGPSRSLLAHVVELLALTVLLYVAARLGLAFATVQGNASPVWPPTGIALAALLLRGPRLWPAVFVASFLAVAGTDAGWLAALLIGLGNAAEALVGSVVLRHVAGFEPALERLRDVVLLAFFGAGLAPLVSTFVGATSLCALGAAPWDAYGSVALTWWTGNALSALLLTPVALAWLQPAPRHPGSRTEIAVAIAGLALASGLTFFRPEALAPADAALAFATFPFLAWIAVRGSRRMSASAVLLVGATAIAGTAMGSGPFRAESAVVAALLVQAFQAVATLSTLLLSAVVAQQRRAEGARRESDLLLRELAAQSDQVFWMMQAHPERVLMVSPAFESAYGRSSESLLEDPKIWQDSIHPNDRARVSASFGAWLRDDGQRSWGADYRVVHPDGAIHWISDTGVKLPAGTGKGRYLAGVARDVTSEVEARVEHQRIEQQMQEGHRLESLGLLAGGVAHDFNNILAVVLGAAQLARTELPADSSALPELDRIEQASRHAADICRQLLISAGQGPVESRPVDVSAIVDESAALLRAALPPGAVLDLRLERGLPRVVADPGQLRQVVMNLVINAGEALRDASGHVCVRTRLVEADEELCERARPKGLPVGRYVALEVEDDGAGMSADMQQRVFDPFYSTKFVGRGLGLATVLGVARAHGGAVLITSWPGRGSTFSILLPPSEHEAAPVAAPRDGAALPSTPRVLVVDDDGDVRNVLIALLESLAATVTSADGGPRALEIFRRDPQAHDLVLLDLSMPGMTGDEVLREMHAIRPETRIVLMSGYTESDVRLRLPELRAEAFLQKPFGIQEIRTRLSALLQG